MSTQPGQKNEENQTDTGRNFASRKGASGLTVMWRVASQDARTVMGSRTYLGLFFAPLLLVLLLGLLVFVVTAMLVAIKLATPEEESSPLGHDRIAVVLDAKGNAQQQGELEEILRFLRAEPPAAPEEARLFRRFIRFLREAQADAQTQAAQGVPEIHPSEVETAMPSPTSVSTAQKAVQDQEDEKGALLKIESFQPKDWVGLKSKVPETYDLALLLEPGESAQFRYRIVSEPGLLYSRLMERRIESRIEEYNHAVGRKQPSELVPLAVHDRPVGPADLWMVRTLLLLAGFSLAFMYHSVGVQSVAGVLAGERDARTLDVLLSLPITRRQILYGKLMGLLLTTATPTLFWSIVVWAPAALGFGISLPYGPLALLIVALLALLTSTGIAVSASSPDLMSAKNRLGMTNLLSMTVGGLLLAVPSSAWPVGWHPLTLLLRGADGGWMAWLLILPLTFLLLMLMAVILELGLWGWHKLR